MGYPQDDGTAEKIAQILGPWKAPGPLMIIGGADRLDPAAHLQRLFLALVARTEAHSDLRGVVIISTATRHPEILTSEYVRIFGRLGVREHLHSPFIRSRDEAETGSHAQVIARSAGIFLTGGDQYTLTQILDRTPVEEAIMEAYGKGAVVAGTSAGATAMGRPMIVAGGGSGELKMGMVQMSRGLAWAGSNIIIDTHFGARGRFPRLAAAVAEHPEALGVGIDENTCLLVDHTGLCTVAGTGVVYLIDASQATLNTSHHTPIGRPMSVGPLQVNILAPEARYDLLQRRPVLASDTPDAV